MRRKTSHFSVRFEQKITSRQHLVSSSQLRKTWCSSEIIFNSRKAYETFSGATANRGPFVVKYAVSRGRQQENRHSSPALAGNDSSRRVCGEFLRAVQNYRKNPMPIRTMSDPTSLTLSPLTPQKNFSNLENTGSL
jgi:hypothetical protein